VDPDLQGSASNKNLDPHPDVRIRIKIYMLDPEPDSDPLRFADVKAKFMEYEPILALLPVFRIHDILVWIRIRGSMPLTNGSGFGSGSKIKSQKESQNSRIQDFCYYFCMLKTPGFKLFKKTC